jgi:glycosyltransferase involved in cell wall biosynthesis
MATAPLFSVVIPTYNRLIKLRRAVGSVEAQSMSDYELIIVDDGSSDGTSTFLDSIRSERKTALRNAKNSGVSATRNNGVAVAKGEFVVFLDDDDALRPNALAALAALYRLEPAADFMWGGRKVHQMDSGGLDVHTREDDWSALRQPLKGTQFLPFVLEIATNSAFAIRRTLFLELGGFDEQLMVSEDRDLFVRLARGGYVGRVSPETIIDVDEHFSDSLSRVRGFQVGPRLDLRVIERHREYLEQPEHRGFLTKYLLAVFSGFLNAGDRQSAGRIFRELYKRHGLSLSTFKSYLRYAPEFRALNARLRYPVVRRLTGRSMAPSHRRRSRNVAGNGPRVLMVASTWWPASARLAIAMARNSCVINAVCPHGHPLEYVSGVRQVYEFHGLGSRTALLLAIRNSKPDFIIPCDDRIVSQLHELFSLHPNLRPLIEKSLGNPANFRIADSRSELLKVATDLSIRIPRSAVLATDSDAQQRFAEFGPVAVIKMDGTHGGEGVRIVRSAKEAAEAFRSLRVSTGLLTAARRLLISDDPLALWSWKRRAKAEITIQEYIEGNPANNMVACWQGETLSEVGVECVSCLGPTGSANVVRRLEHPEMVRAAKLIAAKLGISGFFGLDFMIEKSSGEPYLIEMNPRCTQLGHLQFPDQGDLAGALCERLTGARSLPPDSPIRNDMIGFFPQAWKSSIRGDYWYSAFQDIPWEEKSLVAYLMQEAWPERRWQARTYRWLRGPKRPA